MKLVIEIDLNHGDHDSAVGAFSGAMALLKSVMDQGNIPPSADIREIFEHANVPDAEYFVLCEGGDRDDPNVASSRMLIMRAPFSTKVYSREQSAKRGEQMKTVKGHYEVDYSPEKGFSITDV